MNKKTILLFGLLLLIGSISIYALTVKQIESANVKYYFWGNIMDDEQVKNTIIIEDTFNVKEDQRTFPYLRLKD